MAYKARIMNRHGYYVAAFQNDMEPTPGVDEMILCPPSTGVKIARVVLATVGATQLRDGRSLDIVLCIESD
jgi:hypothetical protein